jgi:surface antigen
MHTRRLPRAAAAALLAAAALAALPAPARGDPPPWAPAHGWRKKNDPYYVGYTGKKWERDYGVLAGRCNREAVGAAIGAVAGAAVGSQVGKGSGRDIAILVGAVTGAIIGARFGRDIDQTDRACIGHALELAGDNKRVQWPAADGRTTYLLTPIRGYQRDGRACREFELTLSTGGSREIGRGEACRTGDGTWRVTG